MEPKAEPRPANRTGTHLEDRVKDWASRHRTGLLVAVGAVVVLLIAGNAMREPAKDWWLAREACGGQLPARELGIVRTDQRLGETQESFDADDGTYDCVLRNENGQVVIAVEAFPEGIGRDRELGSAGSSRPPHAVLPGGLPGFEDDNSLVYLMPDCPRGAPAEAEKDEAAENGVEKTAERRRLLVSTWTYFAHSPAEKAAMLRLAVHMTNVVTEKLGCGGEPLPAPADGAVPDEGTYVPRARAKGTACDALATTRVPEAGRDGEVRIAVADGGIVGRCTLRATESYADAREGTAIVELTSWLGDWGPRVRDWGLGPDPLPMGRGIGRSPALTEDRAWAVARCDGDDVGFAAHWGQDYPDRPRKPGTKYVPPTEAEQYEQRVQLRAYVSAFAADQVRRGACTDLKLPEKPERPAQPGRPE
ncbi:hypothetical protein [Streptomyces durocortorensis]|uniref:Uncharacterized protein n=1 Tax=Streptomyces durocortorensis TaxID=2811104 RepID=A0ABS2HTH2_9ACTN|nr:hypothetical protein [Streptomyces durocortorensis]MBM7052940.1 hypothetical protein [Streptomyces durocortorensis]